MRLSLLPQLLLLRLLQLIFPPLLLLLLVRL
jgi:hypothetical protein